MSAEVAPWVLASGSPRRRALLAGAGARFEVRPVDVDETPTAGEDPLAYALRMAETKAVVGVERVGDGRSALGSDTVVVLDGRILGKPKDEDEAVRMLTALSGRAHAVISAWAFAGPAGVSTIEHRVADVRFRTLTSQDIEAYVATGEPMDKAGSYGIQGHGGALVEGFDGDFSTIIGLPIGPVLTQLVAAGVEPPPASEVGRRAAVIRGRIAAACDGMERDPAEIALVGASKAQPLGPIRDALAAGILDLGESYVQEWQHKRAALGDEARWHFIGRLQRNKAKLLVGEVALIHGVDSPRTIETLGRLAREREVTARLLVQVNVSGEASKGGVVPDELGALLERARGVEGVSVEGLMTLPRPGGLAETRASFRRLRTLRDAHATDASPLPSLSMGMSGDYDAAIVEGATHVRVGTALFGPRAPVAAPKDVC